MNLEKFTFLKIYQNNKTSFWNKINNAILPVYLCSEENIIIIKYTHRIVKNVS